MDKIAVLIPCYNESKTVEKVVSDFRRVLPDATVYVYDNNSTDGTAELAAGAGAVVRHEYQQGKGNVMRRMFREIDAEAYILVDGDDTYPAEAAPEMVAAVTERQADMVVGDRLSTRMYASASISRNMRRMTLPLPCWYSWRQDQGHYDRLPRVQLPVRQDLSRAVPRV